MEKRVKTDLERDLISHCIEHMSSREYAKQILNDLNITIKSSDSLKKMSERLVDAYNADPAINIEWMRNRYRKDWKSECPIEYHINNLKSGKLLGHDWHRASPSMLHRCMQDRVRECCSEGNNIDALLNIGTDIMKQEYFIVATHDIIESSIISRIDNVIPPNGGKKSITDFIISDYPMDLKVTSCPKEQKLVTDDDKICFAEKLYNEADSERTRAQAQKAKNNWGLNRLYVVVKNQDRWFKEPEVIIDSVIKQLKKPNVLSIKVDSKDISVIVIEA